LQEAQTVSSPTVGASAAWVVFDRSDPALSSGGTEVGSSPSDGCEMAARSFGGAAGVGFNVPKDGWSVVGPVSNEAQVRSGDVLLHSIQGDDDTWFIDSGKRCA
jgi:hypothetical protein